MLKMLTGLAARVFRSGKIGEADSREVLPGAGLKGGVAEAVDAVEEEVNLARGARLDDPEGIRRRLERCADDLRSWEAAPTDTDMLDWLDRQSGCHGCESGLVAFRRSTTGRGWRLMEVPDDYAGTFRDGIITTPEREVRKAISDAMLMYSPTDAQAIDWLDGQSGSYTGTVIWRLSTRGLGWRLHETSRDGAKATVREAISDAMRREATVTACRSAAMEPSKMYRITQDKPDVFRCDMMAQDGFEMWKERSLDAAVESVIRAAHTINHASITCDSITIRLLDSVNAALCRNCGDLIISKHVHDFVTCGCGCIAVDGGRDYSRRIGNLCDVMEVPTKALFDRLSKLPAKGRLKEWKRHG